MSTPGHRRSKRIAIANNKGGSGKTAITVNLAAAYAEQGLDVLVAEMDPQTNAGRRLAHQPDPARPTISEAIKADQQGCAGDAFADIGWPEPYSDRITLLPSRDDVENRVLEAAELGSVLRLGNALDGADDDFDLVLIDCPPNLGHLTQMALSAADYAVAVMDPELDGISGALKLGGFVTEKRRLLHNPNLAVAGYIVNRLDMRVGAHSFQAEEGIPDEFGDALILPYINERAVIKDAADNAPPVPVRLMGGRGPEVADAFKAVSKELAKRIGLKLPAEVG
ncbi:ParA family protein [Nonomuraea sp. NPDC050394]|uniref:ParA family protein n=1 Tax=Nonomuraea sp. NPDC050394 TaxID=3364363 RepID=UPI0037A80DFE